jgi:hypothetical protein
MADYNNTAPLQTQDPLPLLQDDLLKDRIRQFVEFLDDEVRLFISPRSIGEIRLTTVE